jgi:hypothetical protein
MAPPLAAVAAIAAVTACLLLLLTLRAARWAPAAAVPTPPEEGNYANRSYYTPWFHRVVPRLWVPRGLDQATSVAGHDQFRAFFARLDAGLPVTVLALGDSITRDIGGCYHRDRWGCV